MLAEYLGCEMTSSIRKKRLREQLRRRIEEHGDGNSAGAVEEIENYLAERPTIETVAIFAALPGEVDLRGLCSDPERSWIFPKVVGEGLVFRRVRVFEEDMIPGAYGIKEPRDGLEEIGISQIDLFFCPGLGFDLKGGRIGRGKGYYDRILERARLDSVKLGVCFGYQLVEEVDMDEHDIRMNGVIVG